MNYGVETMIATEFETLDELETELAGGNSELEWESSLYPQLGEAELPPRRTRVAISPRMRAEVDRHKAAHDRLMRAVAAMRKHVAVRNGRLNFTLPARSTHEAAAKLGIDHSLFSRLHQSLKARNDHAARRGLMATGGSQSRATVSTEVESESRPSCAGTTKVETVWWGIRLWLDECKTQALVNTLKGGGAIGTPTCVALAGPEAAPLCAVLGGLSAGSGFLIDAVDTSGARQGVILSWTWLQIAYPFVGLVPIVVSQSTA
jgi:hypothetical protein